jgi:outer membrane murein-binding lipoprotein Lpp
LRVILPIFLAAASVCILTGCGAMKGRDTAEQAVSEFHAQLDKGDFRGIYSAAHSDFKAASTEKDFVALLAAVHRKLGNIQKSDQSGWRVNSFNLKTNVILTCNTRFAGGDAVETFNYRIDGNRAQLYGYNINSQALITK